MSQENTPHMQPMGGGEQPAAEAAAFNPYTTPQTGPQGSATAPHPPAAGFGYPYPAPGNSTYPMPQGSFVPAQGVAPQYGASYYGYPQPMGWQPPSSPQFSVENQSNGTEAVPQPDPMRYPAGTSGPQQPPRQDTGSIHAEAYVPAFVERATYTNDGSAHTMNGGAFPDGKEALSSFDYSYISSPARIAIYDSLKTAPRVIQVQGGPTHEYIEHIASLTYKNAKEQGGMIPYTVIREVSENFIHAEFCEVVVSIFDQGNTIRFADQGPGIKNKNLVQEPGFSSAIEPMKRYIRGVGSGLPIVKDYLETSHGRIEIEDNVNQGSVVTISLVPASEKQAPSPTPPVFDLTENEETILKELLPEKILGVSEINKLTGIAVSSVHTALSKMEELGLVQKVNKKRSLTAQGKQVALSL